MARRKLTKEGYVVYGGLIVLSIIICLVVAIGPIVLIIVGFSLLSKVSHRQNQINTLNTFTTETWEKELKADVVTEWSTTEMYVEVDSDGRGEWKQVEVGLSTTPKFNVEELGKDSDNPPLEKYEPSYNVALVTFADEEWDADKVVNFRVRVGIGTTRYVESKLFKHTPYECNCVNKCYDLCCQDYPKPCVPCEICDVCDLYERYNIYITNSNDRLSGICLVIDTGNTFGPLDHCFDNIEYQETEKLPAQDVITRFEIRSKSDPDDNSGVFDETRDEKLQKSGTLIGVSIGIAVFEVCVLSFVIIVVLLVIFNRELVKQKLSDLTKQIKNYDSVELVTQALHDCGMESSNLIIGVDYTYENFPLNIVGVQIIAKEIEHSIIDDGVIATFGFGKVSDHLFLFLHVSRGYQYEVFLFKKKSVLNNCHNRSDAVFSFVYGELGEELGEMNISLSNISGIHGLNAVCRHVFQLKCQVLNCYNNITPSVELCGPTSFAPIINKAIEIVNQGVSMRYHILVIICDGEVNVEEPTVEAIKRATSYPLSIVCIGVGDGPWDIMNKFASKLKVAFHELCELAKKEQVSKDILFSIFALNEIPQQYNDIKKLNLLGKKVIGDEFVYRENIN